MLVFLFKMTQLIQYFNAIFNKNDYLKPATSWIWTEILSGREYLSTSKICLFVSVFAT